MQPSQKATVWQKIKWLFINKIEFEFIDYDGVDRGGFGLVQQASGSSYKDIWIAFICVAIIAFYLSMAYLIRKKVEMSFGEALDLTGLPIVTFTQGEHKLNFLLDSGANKSVINSDHLKALPRHTPTGNKCMLWYGR